MCSFEAFNSESITANHAIESIEFFRQALQNLCPTLALGGSLGRTLALGRGLGSEFSFRKQFRK